MKRALNVLCIIMCVILAISTTVFFILYYRANTELKNTLVSSNKLEITVNGPKTTSSNIDTSITKDFGTFDNVTDLQNAVARNPYQTTMLTVTVTGYAYRNVDLYIGDMKELTNYTGRYTDIDLDNAVYVRVNNDISNRARTGDRIRVTGELYIYTGHYTIANHGEESIKAAIQFARDHDYADTTCGFYIANATYEFI